MLTTLFSAQLWCTLDSAQCKSLSGRSILFLVRIINYFYNKNKIFKFLLQIIKRNIFLLLSLSKKVLSSISIARINMIPSEIFAEDLMNTVIRYGLYIGAAFQLFCLLACVTLTDEQSETHPYEKSYTDSDECSSEQSSPGHRATMSRTRRHDKKKRR